MLFCHITSQIEGEKNGDLLLRKGGRGFPHLVYMTGEGDVVASGFDRSVSGFAKAGERATAVVRRIKELEGLAAQGDASAKVELFMVHLNLGRFDSFEAAAAERAKLKLTQEQGRAADAAMVDLEIRALIGKRAAGEEYLPRLIEIDAADLRPRGDEAASFLWSQLLDHWQEQGETEKFASSLKKLEAHFKGNPRFRMYRDMKRATLERMRKKDAAGESGHEGHDHEGHDHDGHDHGKHDHGKHDHGHGKHDHDH